MRWSLRGFWLGFNGHLPVACQTHCGGGSVGWGMSVAYPHPDLGSSSLAGASLGSQTGLWISHSRRTILSCQAKLFVGLGAHD